MKPENVATVISNELLARLQIDDLNMLCWFGYVKQYSGAIKTVCDMQIEGKCGPLSNLIPTTVNIMVNNLRYRC